MALTPALIPRYYVTSFEYSPALVFSNSPFLSSWYCGVGAIIIVLLCTNDRLRYATFPE